VQVRRVASSLSSHGTCDAANQRDFKLDRIKGPQLTSIRKYQRLVLSVPLVFTALYVAAFWTAVGNAAEPKNTSTIRFNIRGVSSVNYSLAFKNGKKDYHWGLFELSGVHFHKIAFNLGQSNPSNPKEFELLRTEEIDIEGGVLEQNCTTRIMIESVDSIEHAIELAEASNKPDQKFFTFRENVIGGIPEWQRAAGYSFLGYGEGGGGSLIDLRAAIGDNVPLIVENKKIEFEVDSSSGFITKLTRILPAGPKPPAPTPEFNPDTGEMEMPQPASQYLGGKSICTITPIVANHFTMTFYNEGRYSDDTRERVHSDVSEITDLSNDVAWPFDFIDPPSEGESIILVNNQQIKAIWQNSKIVRAFDGGVAEELASAKFRKSSRSFWSLATIGFVIVITLGWGFYRYRKVRP